MGVSLEQAERHLDEAVRRIFSADPAVRSVGITRHADGYGYRVVRNSSMILPASVGIPLVSEIQQVPIVVTDTPAEVRSLVAVAAAGPASPAATSVILEVRWHRPLVCGLQIQNYDDDVRRNTISQGFITIGTLGCFARLEDGTVALLSNNHVIAGENRGIKGSDRVLQNGGTVFEPGDFVAVLDEYVGLRASLPRATPGYGAVLNHVDAGMAVLNAGIAFQQGYLPFRELPAPHAVAGAQLGDEVFKVGRTTGLTRGLIVDIGVTVGPVPYDPGLCWFERSFTIEGVDGTLFSDRGDSGSAIVRESGEVLGLLYAGNGTQTFACPIDLVLQALNCTLA